MPQYIVLPDVKARLPLPKDTGFSGILTRFAPSPNGHLHWGHAYAAICAHDFARANGGRFLLRIEDIDGTRSRQEYAASIQEDLRWLGLIWDGEVIFQSTRVDRYRAALDRLIDMGLLYRCGCSRSEIASAASQRPLPHGCDVRDVRDGPVYPGTCRRSGARDRLGKLPSNQHTERPFSWRIDMAAAMEQAGPTCWTDLAAGMQIADPALFGDIVLWRKDAPASYHLAATLDDAADGITHVVRGLDLFGYTAVHALLQKLLALPQPVYWHHDLLLDKRGDKLSKSRGSAALLTRRLAGEDGGHWAHLLRQGKLPLGISVSRA